MSLITSNLFDEILINPYKNGADKLLILSGYATANMVARHAEYLKAITKAKFNLELIVGMCVQDGLEFQNHQAFIEIQKRTEIKFKCQYVVNRPAIHSKIYIWLKDGKPFKGFLGSANYTQNAFSLSMREILAETNPTWAFNYYNSIIGETVNCAEEEIVKACIEIYKRRTIIKDFGTAETSTSADSHFKELPKISLTLLDKSTGDVPKRSGLNWGQRPEYNRNPNQAYINIPADIGRSNFFPERGEVFTITTDDDKQLICVRAQDNGKGLHTTLNNSLLGEYFRYRLGLKNGQEVTKKDLLKYGRTDVDIYKIDEEYYYLDFSVKS